MPAPGMVAQALRCLLTPLTACQHASGHLLGLHAVYLDMLDYLHKPS